ncbi:phosphotransferase [Nostoc sp. DedQUE07]|uniref:phosphotransferase n=1 Tax=Nostoc sp. DedQUE07 TaxID=3075392 RepID=UPI002AD2DA79|nr:phosphotransferase [Nostoc sp. DedQUE07]MDZ8129432.1 phosphotransferase [Nostoc sp. DedQUE07]
MNSQVITDVSQITLEWINSVLFDDNSTLTTRVEDFAMPAAGYAYAASGSDNSHNAIIQLKYQSETLESLPKSLFLKICAGENNLFGNSEVNYYIRDYINLANRPIPACYQAQYDEKTRQYHILMEDLSVSHRSNRKVQPTLAYGCAVAQSLALLHAHFWGTEKLQSLNASIPHKTEIERYVAQAQLGLVPMLEELKAEIDSSWKSVLIDVFQYHPAKMSDRTVDSSGFTLIHGDLNPGNILSPLNANGKTYLIDRQPFDWSLTTWLGVSDLAYMIVHWWETDLRRQWEIPILNEYHTSLISNGISGYSWEQLINDYQLCVVQSIYVATQWCASAEGRRHMKWLWFQQLQKSIVAFFDWQCFELWA